MPSFLTGMPRCRTYWFSQYFNGMEGVTGYHEALNGPNSRHEYYSMMDGENIVNCDSGLYISDSLNRWPDAPVVVVHRDIDEVYASLMKFLGTEPSYALLKEQQEAIKHMRGLHVDFYEIDERLPEIHERLVDVPFDEKYADSMMASNLQMPELRVNLNSILLWRAI